MEANYSVLTKLTKKERMVLAGRYRAQEIHQIADALDLSCRGVKRRIESIYIKLNVHSLQQAICSVEDGMGGGISTLFADLDEIMQNPGRASFKRRTSRKGSACTDSRS